MSAANWVWFQTGPTSWDAGQVLASQGGQLRVKDHEGQEFMVPGSGTRPMHAGMVAGIQDMIELPELTEEGLLHNLCLRYWRDEIYTYTGNILVALNPYRLLDLYGMDVVTKYKNKALGELPPHIFAIANETYTYMTRTRRNQCVVISGESGAGKTESTKLLLQYLSLVSTSKSAVQDQIVDASPILEAFGNAKTVRNDNSSRFGKFVELQFSLNGTVKGAKMIDFLLEKSRIVSQAAEERNYHIFYALLAGASPEEKQALGLNSNKWTYLSNGMMSLPGVDDAADFVQVKEAMRTLAFNEHAEHVMRALASVLHLGNLTFSESESSGMKVAEVSSHGTLDMTAKLLGVEANALAVAITKRLTSIRNETTVTPLSKVQSIDARDALAKAIYGKMFAWIVRYINTKTCQNEPLPFVGILDIFGFEDFQVNSFEQFCINYANERLQYYFNEHIFRMEQQEYTKEGINWSNISFQDNQGCIDMISKRPLGLIYLLDEESNLPKTTDDTMLAKFSEHHAGKSQYYIKPKTNARAFGIRHYAGDVMYQASGFLEKNKDSLKQDIQEVMLGSRSSFVVTLFTPDPEPEDSLPPSPVSPTGRSISPATLRRGANRTRTIGYQFNSSLTDLVTTLTACNPFFVRCLKPNSLKAPRRVDKALLLAQLRYSGMLETIRVRRAGYLTRLPVDEFNTRYRLILPSSQRMAGKDAAAAILQAAAVQPQHFAVGLTKVFLRSEGDARLEVARTEAIGRHVLVIQSYARMILTKRKVARMKRQVSLVQQRLRAFLVRERAQTTYRGVKRLQAVWRGHKTRKMFRAKLQERAEQRMAKEQAQKQAEAKALASGARKQSVALEAVERTWPQAIQALLETASSYDASVMSKPIQNVPFIALSADTLSTAEVEERLGLNITEKNADRGAFARYAGTFFRDDTPRHFTARPLTASLLRLPPHLSATAAEMNKALLCLTVDDHPIAVRFLVLKWLIDHAVLHYQFADEILAQLCRILTENPNQDMCRRAWIILRLMIGILCPSGSLAKPLLHFILTQAPASLMALCQHKLLRTVANGRRRKGLTSLELVAIEQNVPLLLEAVLPDGNSQYFQVDSATTVMEAIDMIAMNAGIIVRQGWTLRCRSSPNAPFSYHSHDQKHVLDLTYEVENADASFLPDLFKNLALNEGLQQMQRRTTMGAGGRPGPPVKAPKPKPGAASLGKAQSSPQTTFYMTKSYLLPLQSMDDAVDLNWTQLQLLRDIQAHVPTIPADSAAFISHAFSNNHIVPAITSAAKCPMYFADTFEVKEPHFAEFNMTHLLLGQTGCYIVNGESARSTCAFQFMYDELEIANAKDENYFRCRIKGVEYCFECDALALAQSIENYIVELKETSTIAIALCDFNPGDGSGFSVTTGAIIEITERDASNGWIHGRYKGTSAWMPGQYVDIVMNPPTVGPDGLAILKPFQLDLIAALQKDLRAGNGAQQKQTAGPAIEVDPFAKRDPRVDDPVYDIVNWFVVHVNTSHDAHDKKVKKGAAATDAQRALYLELNIKWSNQMIVAPITTELADNLQGIAIETYEALLQYTGEMPTKKEKHALASAFVGAGMKVLPLRDELYMQCIKQVTGNPNEKPDSSKRTWFMLAMCCSFFPPSPTFEPYFKRWLSQLAKNTQSGVHLTAAECERRLQCFAAHPRALPPSTLEIEGVENAHPVSLNLAICNGTTQKVLMDPSTTTKDLFTDALDLLGLTEETAPGYCLCMMLSTGELLLPLLPMDVTLDVLSLADILASQRSVATKQPATAQLTLRRKLWLVDTNDIPQCFTLLLGQVLDAFKKGHMFTADHGEKASRVMVSRCIALGWIIDKKDPLLKENKEYVKSSIADFLKLHASASDWEKMAKEEHKHYNNMDQVAAGKEFLKIVQNWPLFGSDSFDIKVVDDKNPKQIIALGAKGISLLLKDTRKLVASYAWKEVVTMRLEAKGFVLILGDLMTKKRIRFETTATYMISHLLISYIQAVLGTSHLEAMQKAQDQA